MATKTTLPLVARGIQLNRISLSVFCNAVCIPVSRTNARTHETKICDRNRFTPRLQITFTGFENIGTPRRDRNSEWSLLILVLLFPTPYGTDTAGNDKSNADDQNDAHRIIVRSGRVISVVDTLTQGRNVGDAFVTRIAFVRQ